jgi:hypothetical protein
VKLSRRETLESGIHDAPLSLIKNVEMYDSFAIELVFNGGGSGSVAALYASCDYDPQDASGNWSLVDGSTQTLDHTNGGIHIWNVAQFLSPFLKIAVTGSVEALEITFIGQPTKAQVMRG